MAERHYQYGFIGAGNMGFAIMKGLLKNTDPSQITFADYSKERCEDVSARTGVEAAADNAACAADCRYLVLAVKPQQMKSAVEQIKDVVGEDQVIISIAAGVTIADLEGMFAKPVRIVRAMPNTPALVGEGMSGVVIRSGMFTEEEEAVVTAFFSSFGKMVRVEEKMINTVICASGSSPAYVYMFMEALADSAVRYGLPRKAAYEMVAQTVLGSAKMLLETGLHPGELKDMVCSPGGTTIAGVAALEEYGLRNAVIKATDACYDKCFNIK